MLLHIVQPGFVFVTDVFPGQRFARVFFQGGIIFGDGPDEGALERAARGARLARHGFHERQRARLLQIVFGREDYQGQHGAIGNLVAALREIHALHTSRAGGKSLLHFAADALVDARWRDVGPPIGQHLVQVGRQAEAVLVAIDEQVVARGRERFQHRLDVADVQIGFGDRQADFRHRGFGAQRAAVRFKEDRRGRLAMQPRFLDDVDGFTVEPHGKRVGLAADVGGHRAFQPCFAQLLEERRAEEGIVERRRAQADQRIAVRALEAFLIGARDPQRQQAQNAARLLKARDGLPFALEHRQHQRVKGIGCRERFAGMIDREPGGHLLAVFVDPRRVIAARFQRIAAQQHATVLRHGLRIPLEQAAADDLRSLGFDGHDRRPCPADRASS